MINKKAFISAIETAKSQNVPVESIYQVIEKSLITAFKKKYDHSSCKVVINPDRNEISLYEVLKVVSSYSNAQEDGDIKEILIEDARKLKGHSKASLNQIIKIPCNIKELSRTSVNAAKAVYKQNLTNTKREQDYLYFKDLIGEKVRAEIIEIKDKVAVLLLSDSVSTILPLNQFFSSDVLKPGFQVDVYIKSVEQTGKGPKILVTRNDNNLLHRVFLENVPEIEDGTVVIKGVARDMGLRSKVAVYSNDPNVDPVGACLGISGRRINSISNALGGEKIDLYEFSNDIETLIKNALSPAEVKLVIDINEAEKKALAIVPDDELSLAIGKNGQNVKLAVQSSGYKIDIKSESDAIAEGLIAA